MTDLIVDACVAAKWLVEAEDSDRARLLLDNQFYLRAPDLLLPEVTNVLWKKTVRGEINIAEMQSIMDILLRDHIDATVRLLPSRILAKLALQIAAEERHTAYDSIYLACAVQARCRLVTADYRFVRSVKNPLLKPHIVALNDPALKLAA